MPSSFPKIPDILTKTFALSPSLLNHPEPSLLSKGSDFLPALICHRNCNRYHYFREVPINFKLPRFYRKRFLQKFSLTRALYFHQHVPTVFWNGTHHDAPRRIQRLFSFWREAPGLRSITTARKSVPIGVKSCVRNLPESDQARPVLNSMILVVCASAPSNIPNKSRQHIDLIDFIVFIN